MNVDKKRLDSYLERISGSVCPLCGTNHWEISDKVFQVIEFDYKGILLNGASLPIVPLTCSNCGNTYFINALMAKLIDRKPSAETNTTIQKDDGV